MDVDEEVTAGEIYTRKILFNNVKSSDIIKSYVAQIQVALEYNAIFPNELNRLPGHLRARVESWKSRC